MIRSFLRKKLGDITISMKLYFTVGIMVFLVTVELFTLWFAVGTLSSVRSFINGEALWSKAQKDAVYSLFIYAHSQKEKDYQAFREYLKVPLGDNKTRVELSKLNPDLEVARLGFIEGRNHRDDVSGMIKLITRFHNISYINRAVIIWGQAEQSLEQFIVIGDKLHTLINSGQVSQPEIEKVLEQIQVLNKKTTKLEDDFSSTLGEGSRWLENVVLKLLLTLSLTIGATSILITISVSKGIEKGIKAIVDGVSLVGEGLLNTRVKVYSRDEIGILATAFNKMTDTLERNMLRIIQLKETKEKLEIEKERAETSEKTKQLFLAKMSHEIRTPMNAILGFAKLMEETLKTKEQQEYIQIIIKSGNDLLVILNDILDFSRIEAGKLNFECVAFNLRDIIHTTILMLSEKAKQKNIAIRYDVDSRIPELLMGDSVRLNQILLNLTSNAIKFTKKGNVSISVNCLEQHGDSIVLDFSVKDTGIGIPLEKQSKIFESFEQVANDATRSFGGAGLGLSIVKQLVTLQNGKVSLISEFGKGSDFHFRLSFMMVDTTISKIIPEKTKIAIESGKGIRVLVVEDNLINQMLVLKVLKKQEFETDVAENGLLALDKLKTNNYDIILMDLQMPKMDGYETTQKIRSLKTYKKDIPIIAMSAHTFKGEYERCLGIGMDEFISKPFDINELYEKIFMLLKKKSLKL